MNSANVMMQINWSDTDEKIPVTDLHYVLHMVQY